MIVIGAKYTHKEKGGEYIVKYPAICKDRDIAVVYTHEARKNFKRDIPQNKETQWKH